MGIEPLKVVAVADGQGAIRAIETIQLAIKRGFRVPDGLVLHYPQFSDGNFSRSELLALDDFVVLKTGGKTLIPQSKFPPTTVFVAEVDPWRDKGIRLGQLLHDLKTSTLIYQMSEYVHGYLSHQVPEYDQAHELTIKLFQRILSMK